MKIGFVIGPTGGKWDGTYYDKMQKDKKNRAWLENVPSKLNINEYGTPYKIKKQNQNRPHVRIDVATAYALKYFMKQKLPTFKLDIIPANEISVARFRKNDMVINQFMDVLIVPFMKQFEKNGIPHEKLRDIYEQTKDIIYPPVNYANLVYNKCAYYSYLKSKNIPTAPTYCISKEEYKTNKRQSIVDIIKFMKKLNIRKVLLKPVHGTDGVDISTVNLTTITKTSAELSKILSKLFRNKRYPQIVVQQYIKEFETKFPQLRLYYIGNKHLFTVMNQYKWKTGFRNYRPTNEVGSKFNHAYTQNVPYLKSCIKKEGAKVMKSLGKFFKGYPKLITRLDFACCVYNKKNKNGTTNKCRKFFVNELEFNPGLYLHMDGPRKFNFDKKLALQLIQVIKRYHKTRIQFS